MTTQDNATDIEYRQALGTFATGVSVITAALESGESAGITVNSFTSVSLHPPLILWCLANTSDSFDTYSRASHFAVNILASDQMKLSVHFAKKQKSKYKRLDFERGNGGAPLLAGCVSWLQCRTVEQYDAGDHRIFIGEVEKFDTNGKESLLYHHGNYAISLPLPDMGTVSPTDKHTDDNLYSLLHKAIHTYQENFEKRQHQFIGNTYEARILVLMHNRTKIKRSGLDKKLQLPASEISDLLDDLRTQGLIKTNRLEGHEYVLLTKSGKEKSDNLWALHKQYENDVMALFKKKEAEIFRENLLRLVNWQSDS